MNPPAGADAPTDSPAPPPALHRAALHQAWARYVGNLTPMSAQQASGLRPSDIGVSMGPWMTQEQFEEYRKKRKVHVIGKPK